ncbi:MAG: molecular chaperone DnaJ [Pseudomonadota bacterium]
MSQDKRDYYEVLGVDRGADDKTIKSAYRKLALQHHPDKNPGDKDAEEKFKEASEAYAVLSDAEKRATFDRFGHQGLGGQGFDPFAGFGFGAGGIGDLFSEVFGEFLGGGRGRGRRGRGSRGSDLRYNLSLSFEEAAFGVTKEIRYPRQEPCETCAGSGAKPGTGPTTCRSCGGAGEVRLTQGFFTVARPCTSCSGRGQVIQDPCTSCAGRGLVDHEHEVSIEVPAGVDEGNRIRHPGEGEPGMHGGPPGDLYVVLHIEAHPLFVRDEVDVICELPLSITQAALGARLQVPTLDGKVELKIPEGTQTGKVFRLRGKGIPVLQRQGRGDQLVRVVVETPTNLSDEQRELLGRFAELAGENSAPRSKGFFDKVRELFDA